MLSTFQVPNDHMWLATVILEAEIRSISTLLVWVMLLTIDGSYKQSERASQSCPPGRPPARAESHVQHGDYLL